MIGKRPWLILSFFAAIRTYDEAHDSTHGCKSKYTHLNWRFEERKWDSNVLPPMRAPIFTGKDNGGQS